MTMNIELLNKYIYMLPYTIVLNESNAPVKTKIKNFPSTFANKAFHNEIYLVSSMPQRLNFRKHFFIFVCF